MNADNQNPHPLGQSVNLKAPLLPRKELESYVQAFLKRKAEFLGAADGVGSPLYLFDRDALLSGAQRFKNAFSSLMPDLKIFFAMKSNNYPGVAEALTQAGLGLDVSSGLELTSALKLRNNQIIFSGPGKTPQELDLAAAHAGRVTVLVDSFSELDRLEHASAFNGIQMRAGVRICSEEKGMWRKFGIPLDELHGFARKAASCPHVDLCGLQFHTSWNLDSSAQTKFLKRLGQHLAGFDHSLRSRFKFLDIGGGYWPETGEWLQSPDSSPQPGAQDLESMSPLKHYRFSSQAITGFARDISQALNRHIFPLLDCTIYTEPGRWLCNGAMHILLTVLDKKSPDMVITDGGINLIGWERFETDYAPLINLSSPSINEQACWVMGSLCTPHDIWGYSYFGQGIQPGDRLLVPDQGAYTYSLRQSFIKPLAPVVNLRK